MFLVNVKWVERVNVLVHPKGPHKNITGPLWDLFGHILLNYRPRWEFKLKYFDIECCVFNFRYRIRQFLVKFILKANSEYLCLSCACSL